MALNKHDPRLQVLIRQAAEDVRRLNPHIGAAQQPETEAQYTEVKREREELERIWAEMERQRGGPLTDEPAAHAVDEDRGE
jgi:hypothetical protein